MQILASGYPSLDHIIGVSHSPTVGETAIIPSLPPANDVHYGGCGANVVVGLRHLGIDAGVGMVIGDDALGDQYQTYLRGLGANTENVIVMPGQQTSQSFLYRNPQGEYQNFFFAGAADAWDGELALTGLESLRYGLMTVASLHYNRQFAACMLAANVPLIWQMKPDVYAFSAETVAQFARQSHLIIMNNIEANYLLKTLRHSTFKQFLSDTTKAIVVTHGAQGVRIVDHSGDIHIPAMATEVIDTTGAGDGFTAGFLAGMLRGQSLATCGRWGVAMASFVLERVGCQTNFPTWEALIKRAKEALGGESTVSEV